MTTYNGTKARGTIQNTKTFLTASTNTVVVLAEITVETLTKTKQIIANNLASMAISTGMDNLMELRNEVKELSTVLLTSIEEAEKLLESSISAMRKEQVKFEINTDIKILEHNRSKLEEFMRVA